MELCKIAAKCAFSARGNLHELQYALGMELVMELSDRVRGSLLIFL